MQAQSDRAERIAAPYGDALSASLEDYLEAILLLERASRVARVSEIAEQLERLAAVGDGRAQEPGARGLVLHARYGHVTLTEEGARIALDVERRHLAIRDFLTGSALDPRRTRPRPPPAGWSTCSSPRCSLTSSPTRRLAESRTSRCPR